MIDPTTMKSRRDDFAELLAFFRRRRSLSQNALALRSGINHSYLCRIENGIRPCPPRTEMLELLLDNLRLSDYERDRLLVAGGFAPSCVSTLGHWPRVLDLIAHALTELEEEEREELVYVLAQVTMRFHQPAEQEVAW